MLFTALFSDPPFERQDMESALVRYGNDMADKAGLPLVSQVTECNWSLFTQKGFKVVRHLDLDLKDWQSDDSHSRDSDIYRFRYLLRLPQTLCMV